MQHQPALRATILHALRRGPLDRHQLATAVGAAQLLVARELEQLHQDGLVERFATWRLTDEGRSLFEPAISAHARLADDAWEPIPDRLARDVMGPAVVGRFDIGQLTGSVRLVVRLVQLPGSVRLVVRFVDLATGEIEAVLWLDPAEARELGAELVRRAVEAEHA